MNHFVAINAQSSSRAADIAGNKGDSRRRIAVAAACGVFAAASFVIGAYAGLQRAAELSHSRGACIALEFAENFGALGGTQKRQAMHAMSTSAGRHNGLFPKSVAEFEDLCIRTWASDVRPVR